MRRLILLIGSLVVLPACTSQQLYDTAGGARQNQCEKLADSDERAKCSELANRHYDQYARDQLDKPKY